VGTIGFILTALGFLGGAFLASLDPSSMRWELFIPCLLLGAGGVYLIKRTSLRHALSDETLANNRAHIEDSLLRIIAGLKELESGKDEIPHYQLRFEIDHRFRTDLNRFADARQSLSHMFGLQAYADIMSAFAAGERYLLGARLVDRVFMLPLMDGQGLSVSVIRCAGHLTVTAVWCPGRAPGLEDLQGRTDRALAELEAATRRSAA